MSAAWTLRRAGLSQRRLLSSAHKQSPLLNIAPRVREALRNGEPVVALESTIISHGMPYPQNVETARGVEQIVTASGSTPATIALIDGRIHVGLSDGDLLRLANGRETVVKASRRDMAAVLSQRLLGATTVSGTMLAANMAGISVFATGGIGGVHRGAEDTMDVSADLTELGRTPVAVVCAGAKSILDLPKTLEYLETQGVPVVTFGDSSEFPAFFSRYSGLQAPWKLQRAEQVAQLLKTSAELGLQNGVVVAVPIPEEHSKASVDIEQAIEAALRESERLGVKGKEATPFLLKRVVERTGGASLLANIALVKNNARVASQIAVSLASMGGSRAFSASAPPLPQTRTDQPLLVIGCAAMDITSRVDLNQSAMLSATPQADLLQQTKLAATSHPGTVFTSVGGVAQNIARAAHLLGANAVLLAALGQDAHGTAVAADLRRMDMDTRFLQYPGSGARTAIYNALHGPDGDLVAAVADMHINGLLSPHHIEEAFDSLRPRVVCVDANVSTLAIVTTLIQARESRACVVFEPTSMPKCTNVLSALLFIKRSHAVVDTSSLVHIITPNSLELQRMSEAALELALVEGVPTAATVSGIAEFHYLLDTSVIRNLLTLFPLFPTVVVKLGEQGAAVISPSPRNATRPIIRHIQPLKPSLVENSSGAGDSLVGAILAQLHMRPELVSPDGSLALAPQELDTIVSRAQRAAIMAIESMHTVSDRLNPDVLNKD
ncbi:hypothetical protein GGH12_001356 [Coemansia sp. RSA 1822]|nr:hypothetical protein LPJ76_005178 [Coemansia sp. RSA 638]KAJ2565561.1 hypothetical protein GGH12_001356 [Coemansia sp. RSA 1822]